jgi:hypothetical protein
MRRTLIAIAALIIPLVAAAPHAFAASAWKWCSASPNDSHTWPNGQGGSGLTDGQITFANEWSGDGSPEQMCANGPSDVRITSRQPNGNTAVEAYPTVQYNLPTPAGQHIPGTPATKLREVRSYYTETSPSSNSSTGIGIRSNGVDNEFASDDWWWVPTETNQEAYEVMVWADDQGQSPGGTLQAKYGIIKLAGKYYELWDGCSGSRNCFAGQHPHGYFVFFQVNPAKCKKPSLSCASAHAKTGFIPHLATEGWLVAHGLMEKTSVLAQEEIGFEICGDPRGGGTYTISPSHLVIKTRH